MTTERVVVDEDADVERRDEACDDEGGEGVALATIKIFVALVFRLLLLRSQSDAQREARPSAGGLVYF